MCPVRSVTYVSGRSHRPMIALVRAEGAFQQSSEKTLVGESFLSVNLLGEPAKKLSREFDPGRICLISLRPSCYRLKVKDGPL